LFVKEKKKRLAFFNQDSGRNAITFSIYFLWWLKNAHIFWLSMTLTWIDWQEWNSICYASLVFFTWNSLFIVRDDSKKINPFYIFPSSRNKMN
jgi:hypothetical protein